MAEGLENEDGYSCRVDRLSHDLEEGAYCKGYCQSRVVNKTCGKITSACNNLNNATKKYKTLYRRKRSSFFQTKLGNIMRSEDTEGN